ncbi:MAG: L-threonylcarbamoyladenylate synthase [Nitrospinaceae bacterium]
MPETLKIDIHNEEIFRDQLVKIKRVLNLGGVIAFPTDTFYGLGANPFHEEAVAGIFKIKHRLADKALPVLVRSIHQVKHLASEITQVSEILMENFWPGPLTLVLKALPHLPPSLTANTGKIGVRQPGNDITQKLLSGIGFPLTATSANISGSGNIMTAQRVRAVLGSQVDLLIDGGITPGGKPSTILDTTLTPPLVIREGAVSKERIESVTGVRCLTMT